MSLRTLVTLLILKQTIILILKKILLPPFREGRGRLIMKKLFTLFLALVASVSAIYASDTQVDGVYYDFNSSTKTATVTYRGSNYNSYDNEYSGSVVIPSSVTYNGTTYSVTSIGEWAFGYCSSLTSVTIPNSVTSIGELAFYWCSSLTSITIGNSVTNIGSYAFSGCSSLTSVTIPNSVTSVRYDAFEGCTNLSSVVLTASSIEEFCIERGNAILCVAGVTCKRKIQINGTEVTNITIPNSVTSIGYEAFAYCSSLTSVTIPNSVTSIGDNAFYDCSGLTSVTINSDAIMNKSYSNDSNIRNIFGSQVTEYIIGNDVKSISDYVFHGCSSLTSVIIPNSVISIGEEAFRNCSKLTSVTIPNSVTSIGSSAFYWCSSLASVTIPNSVTSIGEWAFGGCSSLNSVHVNDIAAWCKISFGSADANPLYYAHNLYLSGKLVKDLVIPNGVTFIGNSAFYNCSSLTSVTIPNTVRNIGSSAFDGCTNLTSVTIPNSVTLIGDYAFSTCRSLTSLIIPNSVKHIGHGAFFACHGLKSLTFGNAVTKIGDYAFNHCYYLTSITIPNSVTSIGENAFDDCKGLTSVIWNAKNCNSYNFGSNITTFTFGEEVESIPDSLCFGMNKLTSITIPNSVTSIGESAFDECTGLTSVMWNAKNCNNYNFGSNITTFTFGKEVEFIPDSLCSGMNKLTSITIPNNVTNIGERAFYGCTSVTSILIPQKVNKIGSMAFAACPSRTSIRVDSGNSTYDSRNNCNGIVEKSTNKLIVGCKTTVIPNDVKCIGDYAFYGGASSLTSITIPASVESIGEYAFGECPRLYDIYSYANRPPLAKQSSFSNYNAFVYVPCESQRYYVLDEIWSNFNNYECISSDNVTTDEIVVTPSENEANVIWPSVNGAASYELVIKDKDGNIVCTLIFNANGQLTSIAFNAPSRNGVPAQTQSAGFSFTITGLDSGTGYDLTLTAKDNSGNIIEETTIPFQTNKPEGIEDVQSNEVQSTKVIKDGQVLILRNGKTYTMQGQEVK